MALSYWDFRVYYNGIAWPILTNVLIKACNEIILTSKKEAR